MPAVNFIIYASYCVHDSYREIVKTPLRSRGFKPKLTDCEVITLEIVGEFMGKDKDKAILQYFTEHWKILCHRFIRKILAHTVGTFLNQLICK